MIIANISITNPQEVKIYGVRFVNDVWIQATTSPNHATHIAVLNEIPDLVGVYSGSIYEDGEMFEAPDTITDVFITWFAPENLGLDHGVLEIQSNANPLEIDMFGMVVGGNLVVLKYVASFGGTISGNITQTLQEGELGTEVVAIPNEGFEFYKWSDNLGTANRTDLGTKRTFIAYFIDSKSTVNKVYSQFKK